MDKRDTGGSAFPQSPGDPTTASHSYASVYGGMTLRDWFAGKALAQQYPYQRTSEWPPRKGDESPEEFLAAWVYRVADAMLAERAK